MIKLRVLRGRVYTALFRWAQCNQESLLERGRKIKSQRPRQSDRSRGQCEPEECRQCLEARKGKEANTAQSSKIRQNKNLPNRIIVRINCDSVKEQSAAQTIRIQRM